MNTTSLLTSLQNQFYEFLPSLGSGLAVLVLGLIFSSLVSNYIKTTLMKSKIETELSLFLAKIIKVTLQIVILISALSIVGVKTSSFLAVIGSAGLAIGLALQGSLSNFAGGVLILILKPFRLDDFIEYSGNMGTVESINIFNTKIRTGDNRVIIIPNGPLANSVVINYSEKDTRRNEWVFGIGYDDDIKKAKQIIADYLSGHDKVLKDPEPLIAVNQLTDSSVNILVRAWCSKDDFWPLQFQAIEELKVKFDESGISIPYPQRDVHLHNQ